MSNVSFSASDITKIKFNNKTTWGGDDKFTIIEERWLIEEVERSKKNKSNNNPNEIRNKLELEITPELVLSVYRNIRENYEFRLRYGDAGEFFVKEMELKRNFRTIRSRDKGSSKEKVIKNNWFRRHFSLTGLYHHLSDYGESIVKPTIIGVMTVGLSTLFWSMQASPSLLPTFSINTHTPYSNFTGLYNITNHIHLLKAFERSLGDFLPLLPSASDIKIGAIDYIIKIVGGALTFGLLIIALRRKFERKYTR